MQSSLWAVKNKEYWGEEKTATLKPPVRAGLFVYMMCQVHVEGRKSSACAAACSARQGHVKLDGATRLIRYLGLLCFGFYVLPKGQRCQRGLQLSIVVFEFMKFLVLGHTSLHANQPGIPPPSYVYIRQKVLHAVYS